MIPQLFGLFKTLMMQDSDPSDINKPWYERRRVIQGIIALVGFGLYYEWGLVLDNDMKDLLWDNYQVIVNSAHAIAAVCVTVYGIVGTIKGKMQHTKKVKSLIAKCQK